MQGCYSVTCWNHAYVLFVQAMKLLDHFSSLLDTSRPVRVKLAEWMTHETQQLRLQVLANLVQLMVPLVAVPDLTATLIAPFKSVAASAGLRYC